MKHYNLKTFLRTMPNAMLAAYFQANDIETAVDFATLKPYAIDPLFEAIQSLPEKQRKQVDTDFQDIFALSYDGGISLLLDEGRYLGIDLVPEFEPLKGHEAKAMWSLLHCREIFNGALQLSCRDNLTGHWKARRGIPSVDTANLVQQVKILEKTLGLHFRNVIGGGKACTVDYKNRGRLQFFFTYPEGYSKTTLHYHNGKLRRDHLNIVQEVIFVYDVLAGSLEIYYAGNKEHVSCFQDIFGESILGIKELPPDEKPTFFLEPLKRPDFQFVYAPDSGITGIIITRLELTYSDGGLPLALELKAGAANTSAALYHMLDTHCPLHSQDRRPARENTFVQRAHIRVYFAPKPGCKRSGSRTFYITDPDGTNLKHDERDMIIRRMLKDSKLMADDANTQRQAA